MYLQQHNATVELVDEPNRDDLMAELGVPKDTEGCHTALVDDYAIEGHVPVGAIQKLLAEKPNAVGLGLGGMPGDSPGMGGDEATWESQPVMLIQRDGTLTPFDY